MKAAPLIRDARHKAGISQAELAKRVGTQQPAVARWERGDSEPRVDTLGRLLKACGFELSRALVAIDETQSRQLREQLALSPAQRVSQLVRTVRFIERARQSAADS